MIATKRGAKWVRDATLADREWIATLLRERWHGTQIAAHGEVIDALELPALIVDDRRGLATGGGLAATLN